MALQEQRNYGEAAKAYDRALELASRAFGPEHLNTAAILNNQANVYKDMGRYAQAEPLYQRSLKIKETQLGPDHPAVAWSLNNLALVHSETGHWPEAVAETERERRIVRRHVARTLPILSEKEQLTFLQAKAGQEADYRQQLRRG